MNQMGEDALGHGAAADVAVADEKYFYHSFFSLNCPEMPCFARVSGVIVICSKFTDFGKSEQDGASCYYLLVVKLVVKGKGLLLRIVY